MNKKLLKTLLIGTALTSVSLGGIATSSADSYDITIENYNVSDKNTTGADSKPTVDLTSSSTTLNFKNAENKAQTFFLDGEAPINIGEVTITSTGGLTLDVQKNTENKIASVKNDNSYPFNIKFSGNDTNLAIEGQSGTVSALDFGGNTASMYFNNKATISSISNGTDATLISQGSSGDVTIDGKSSLKQYYVTDKSKIMIKNNATAGEGGFILERPDSNESEMNFDSANNTINVLGNFNFGTKNNGGLARVKFSGTNTITVTGNMLPIGDNAKSGGGHLYITQDGGNNNELGSNVTVIGNVGKIDAPLQNIAVDNNSRLTLKGTETVYSSTLDLHSNAKLDISGGGPNGKGIEMSLSGDTKLDDATLIIGNESKISGTGTVSRNNNITIDASAVDIKMTGSTLFANYGSSNTDNIILDGNTYTKYTAEVNDKVLLISNEIKVDELQNDLGNHNYDGVAKAVLDALSKVQGNVSDKAFTIIAKAGQQTDATARQTYIVSVIPTNKVPVQNQIISSINGSLNTVANVLQSRNLGVAAADDMSGNTSIWFKGFAGMGNQSVSTSVTVDPYESSIWGGMGAIESSNDNGAFGVAMSYANTDVTYDNGAKKDEYKTLAGSFYGSHEFNSGMLVNGSFTAGKSDIKSSVSANETVSTISTGGSLMAGYKSKIDQFAVTPLVGVRFSDINIPENNTANSIHNSATDVRTVELALGGSISKDINNGAMSMRPELHSFVHYNINGTTSTRGIVIPGLTGGTGNDSISYSMNRAPMNWNLGGSLTTQSDMVEYSASVDANFADSYWDVQGSLKVKVKL